MRDEAGIEPTWKRGILISILRALNRNCSMVRLRVRGPEKNQATVVIVRVLITVARLQSPREDFTESARFRNCRIL